LYLCGVSNRKRDKESTIPNHHSQACTSLTGESFDGNDRSSA
jgi:hypothetical protein